MVASAILPSHSLNFDATRIIYHSKAGRHDATCRTIVRAGNARLHFRERLSCTDSSRTALAWLAEQPDFIYWCIQIYLPDMHDRARHTQLISLTTAGR